MALLWLQWDANSLPSPSPPPAPIESIPYYIVHVLNTILFKRYCNLPLDARGRVSRLLTQWSCIGLIWTALLQFITTSPRGNGECVWGWERRGERERERERGENMNMNMNIFVLSTNQGIAHQRTMHFSVDLHVHTCMKILLWILKHELCIHEVEVYTNLQSEWHLGYTHITQKHKLHAHSKRSIHLVDKRILPEPV